MRREISSSANNLNKITVSLIFGVLIPVFLVILILKVFSLGCVFPIVIYIAVGTLFIRYNLNLKNVVMSETGLFISQKGFGRNTEIFVPFTEIENVKISFWDFNSDNITIKFRNLTKFGNKISFTAKTRHFRLKKHPIIKELQLKSQTAELHDETQMPASCEHSGISKDRPPV